MVPLIIDLTRRSRWTIAFMMLALLAMLWGASMSGDVARATGTSMGVAFWIGTAGIRYLPRAIWYLPLSRRDIWRGSWLFATAGGTALTTAGKLLMMAVLPGGGGYRLAGILLSSAYDFAFCGIGCACVIAAMRPLSVGTPWRQASMLLRFLAEAVLAVAGFAAFYSFNLADTRLAELVTRQQLLALQWSDVSMQSGTVLALALTITIAAYFHSPSPPPRVEQGGVLFERVAAPAFRPHAAHEASGRRVGLSGLPRLLAHESAWTLRVGGGAAVLSAVACVTVAVAWGSPQMVAHVLSGKLQAFGGTTPSPARGLDLVGGLFWYVLFVISLATRVPSMLRHLRVLPLGARNLNALLVLWPLLVWLTVWTIFVPLHYLATGRGLGLWHAAFFAALAGSSALVQALTLRLGEPLRVFSFAVGAGVVPFMGVLDAPPAALLAWVGAGGLAAAAWVNHAALRRSATYRPLSPVLGAHGP